MSTGFCGALDPAIQPLEISSLPKSLVALPDPYRQPSRDRKGASVYPVTATRPYQTGTLISQDRVASTIAEKSDLAQNRRLRNRNGSRRRL